MSDSEYTAFVARVRARCEEVGDCWVWQGARKKTNDQPVLQLKERRVVNIRRHLAQLAGRPQANDRTWSATSGKACEAGCVNPEHVRLVNRPTLQRESAAAMDAGTVLARRKKMFDRLIERGCARLTDEMRAEIDASDEPAAALARRFGVVKSTVSAYRNGLTFVLPKMTNNPFQGLMR